MEDLEQQALQLLAGYGALLNAQNTDAVVEDCIARCHRAFDDIYSIEEDRCATAWSFPGVYEQTIAILYERFSFAMAMLADQFRENCGSAQDGVTNANNPVVFALALNAATDATFKYRIAQIGRVTKELALQDGTTGYFREEFSSDEYYEFWENNVGISEEIARVRDSYLDRSFLFGFSETEDDANPGDNLDSLHIKRVCALTEGLDVDPFLHHTKQDYLPRIIGSFILEPAKEPPRHRSRWQFWKYRPAR